METEVGKLNLLCDTLRAPTDVGASSFEKDVSKTLAGTPPRHLPPPSPPPSPILLSVPREKTSSLTLPLTPLAVGNSRTVSRNIHPSLFFPAAHVFAGHVVRVRARNLSVFVSRLYERVHARHALSPPLSFPLRFLSTLRRENGAARAKVVALVIPGNRIGEYARSSLLKRRKSCR